MRNHKNFNFSVIAGHIIECFDNTLYGFFAVMLAPIFFPPHSPGAGLLASYGAFAAGFLARPIGALIFGWIGDQRGRKEPLLWSMMLVGLPTIGISLTPSFETLGLIAPCLLILCRLTQGLFMGGEFAAVNLYIAEHSNKIALGHKTGVLISSGGFGAVLATIVGALVTMKVMPPWAWRLPFFLGGCAAFTLYYMRRKLVETHDFTQAQKQKTLLKYPIKEVLRDHPSKFIVACLIAGLTVTPLYLTTVFGNQLFRDIGFSPSQSLLLNMLTMLLDSVLIVYFGRLADRLRFYPQMLLGTLSTAAVAVPAFFLIANAPVSTLNIYLFIILLNIAGCVINGCAMPYIAQFFPTRCRYSGVALSVTLGHALLGGTTPLISSSLIYLAGTRMAPAFWLVGYSLVTAAGIYWIQTRKRLSSTVESTPAVPLL